MCWKWIWRIDWLGSYESAEWATYTPICHLRGSFNTGAAANLNTPPWCSTIDHTPMMQHGSLITNCDTSTAPILPLRDTSTTENLVTDIERKSTCSMKRSKFDCLVAGSLMNLITLATSWALASWKIGKALATAWALANWKIGKALATAWARAWLLKLWPLLGHGLEVCSWMTSACSDLLLG